MSKPVVTDALWTHIAPLLPPERPKLQSGRPRIADRAALAGILFVLKSGIPWEMLPQELGCGSGIACLRRLQIVERQGSYRQRGLGTALLMHALSPAEIAFKVVR